MSGLILVCVVRAHVLMDCDCKYCRLNVVLGLRGGWSSSLLV